MDITNVVKYVKINICPFSVDDNVVQTMKND